MKPSFKEPVPLIFGWVYHLFNSAVIAAFAPLTVMPMVAMGSLGGHLIFGVITGLVYLPVAAATGASSREVAR